MNVRQLEGLAEALERAIEQLQDDSAKIDTALALVRAHADRVTALEARVLELEMARKGHDLAWGALIW